MHLHASGRDATQRDVPSAQTSARISARRYAAETESELSAGPLPAEATPGKGAEAAAAVRSAAAEGLSSGAAKQRGFQRFQSRFQLG